MHIRVISSFFMDNNWKSLNMVSETYELRLRTLTKYTQFMYKRNVSHKKNHTWYIRFAQQSSGNIFRYLQVIELSYKNMQKNWIWMHDAHLKTYSNKKRQKIFFMLKLNGLIPFWFRQISKCEQLSKSSV